MNSQKQSQFRQDGNFTIRGLPSEIMEWLEKVSAEDDRSVTSTIRLILQKAMKWDERQTAKKHGRN